MSQIIQAIYENGVLHPLAPLNLKQKQVIQFQIVEVAPADKIKPIIQSIVEEGILTLPPGCHDENPVSESERIRLSEILGKSLIRPVSEIIIEERERL